MIAVENEVIRLINEIENVKGQLRKQEHLSRYADIQVLFRFKDRGAPIADGSSSFNWINQLNITDVIQSFQYNYTYGSKQSSGSIPTGFAQYKSKKDLKATSHDGVFYRIYTVEPKPRANDSFWAEAVSKRMTEAGYHPLDGQDSIQAEQLEKGYLIQTLAPNGADDLCYWIAFHQRGAKLIIIEALGEVSRFTHYEKEIKAAIHSSLSSP